MPADARGPRLSVVIPVYNEEENLEPLVTELAEVLPGVDPSFEVILVNDGSTDAGPQRIARLVGQHGFLRAVHLRERSGQTAAFAAGFAAARGDVVVTMDADLQNDPRDIPKLLGALQDPAVDAAAGYRVRRSDPWIRRVSSRIANAVRNRVSGDRIRDTGCSLKAFRRQVLDGLLQFDGMHRFLPTLVRMRGGGVVEVPVRHRPRVAGRSKYGVFNRVFRATADLLAVRWMRSRVLRYEVARYEP